MPIVPIDILISFLWFHRTLNYTPFDIFMRFFNIIFNAHINTDTTIYQQQLTATTWHLLHTIKMPFKTQNTIEFGWPKCMDEMEMEMLFNPKIFMSTLACMYRWFSSNYKILNLSNLSMRLHLPKKKEKTLNSEFWFPKHHKFMIKKIFYMFPSKILSMFKYLKK